MSHHPWAQELKKDVMTKRATGRRGTFKNYNLKDRLFVLTPTHLGYYEGNAERRGREKGNLELSEIKAIERLDEKTFDKKFGFQVIFEDFPLYIFAKTELMRTEWIQILREEVKQRNDCLVSKFHGGAFLNGEWSCCKEKLKTSVGCKETHFASVSTRNDSATNGRRELFKVTAKYNYEPTTDQKDDLALAKDKEYTVTDSREKNWWFARDELGREGFIPSNFVKRHVGIECEKWYHGDMTRQEADEVLKDINQDGTYLVRNSSQSGMYTLSFCFQGIVKHYHIRMDHGRSSKYYVSQRHHFDTVSQLIEYHSLNSAGLVTRLRFPYTGSDNPPVILGSGIFEIDRNALKLLRVIGTGQFGTVHEAKFRERGKVAVKMMKMGAMSEHDFIAEAKVMQRFQHKNLVSIYGVCSLQSPLLIVVELLVNGSLLDYLRKNKQILNKTQTLIDMVFQISAAMKYLEEEKFIHRDLAARNCLVGERHNIKVGDFGLARYVLDDQYTASEGTKFPVKWAAPEVMDYTKFSSKSDVWAFGILCWEVFSGGKTPYPTFSNPQVAEEEKGTSQDVDVKNQVRNGYRLDRPQYCPTKLYEIMKQCWEQEKGTSQDVDVKNQIPENRPTFKHIHQWLQIQTEDFSD